MKARNILAALLLTGVQTVSAQKVILKLAGSEPVKYDVSQLEYIAFEEDEPVIDGHEWVDLGLPSGTLWATCNVGANSPEEYGDYFAWGETTGYMDGKISFSWRTYKYCSGTYDTLTKYCTNNNYGIVDGILELEPSDDAATANWGADWQMPSFVQIQELVNNTTSEWTTLNGVNGRKITSKINGNSIFLPAAGYYNKSTLQDAGTNGYYWSHLCLTGNSNDGYDLRVGSSGFNGGSNGRYRGQSIRPVRVE